LFLQTLDRIFAGDAELIAFFQRLLGYGLSGTQSEHILAVFEGSGANGKSTLLKTLSDILGEIVLAAQSELILAQKFNRQSGASDSATVALRGRRYVYCEETDDGQKIDEGKVKRITGGGIITARAPWAKREISFRATYLLILCTNHKPRVTGTDYAIWRRIMLIPFTQRFVNNPTAPNELKADKDLPAKLRAEASGILAWLVRGCIEWQRQGLNPPEVVTAATAAYRNDEDLMKHFLDDCCLMGSTCEVKASEFYKAYQRWCDENGHRSLSGTRFGKDMKARFDSYQDYKGVSYIGVGLLES
jgi:putative DNA primase/helicase